jgi:hypothetical protein
VRADDIYPYLVTSAYPEWGGGTEAPIGHGIRVTIVVDLEGMVRNLTSADLRELGMSWDDAMKRALENLDRLEVERVIQMQLYDEGPSGQPFILVGGHWTAAAFLLSRKLQPLATEALRTRDLCASVPNREALLVFPKGSRGTRDSMRAMIREKEADSAKPLTWDLFELTENGPRELSE